MWGILSWDAIRRAIVDLPALSGPINKIGVVIIAVN
jgi:hypothetical protein